MKTDFIDEWPIQELIRTAIDNCKMVNQWKNKKGNILFKNDDPADEVLLSRLRDNCDCGMTAP